MSDAKPKVADTRYANDDEEIEILEVVGIDDEVADEADEDGADEDVVFSLDADEEPEDIDVALSDAEAVANLTPLPASAPEILPTVPAPASDPKSVTDRDRLVRLQADFENFKKRTEKRYQDMLRYAAEPLVRELLTVVDNLERALAHADECDTPANSIAEGLGHQLVDRLLGAGMTAPQPGRRQGGQPADQQVDDALGDIAGTCRQGEAFLESCRGAWHGGSWSREGDAQVRFMITMARVPKVRA